MHSLGKLFVILMLVVSIMMLPARLVAQWLCGRRGKKYSEGGGPRSAAGVLIYLHGRVSGDLDTLPIPRVLVQMARAARWDVLRINRVPYIDVHWEDDGLLKFVSAEVKKAREAGYREVIVAGHSRGGWLSLSAASLEAVDGVIGLAPGTLDFTDESLRESSLTWQRDELVRRLSLAKVARIAAFYFDGGPFDGIAGGRAIVTRQVLEATQASFMVVANPPGFTGHMAPWGSDFSRTYADCLVTFMRSPAVAGEYRCGGPDR
jgi:pimeloyl-ACP methyl ester carboxylesterase